MKRLGNVYNKIYSMDNLRLAHDRARKGKTHYKEVKMVDSDIEGYLKKIHDSLYWKTYTTSKYEVEKITDRGKERIIHKLPYYPDRIVQWAMMIHIEDVFLKTFVYDTYAALPNKGTHEAMHRMKEYMKDRKGTQYCYKFDIKKFFPSIDKVILKGLMRRKFKDKDLLWLLDDIIDSCDDGVPIGNYTSQYFGNFYLSYFDHWCKENKGIKYYLRYMDDIVILHESKDFLHELRVEIEDYMRTNLNLKIKGNWQVFPTYIRGVDFVGYRVFENYTLLRKSTALNLKRKMKLIKNKVEQGDKMNYSEWCSINSYGGWLKHCDGFNLKVKHIDPLSAYSNDYYKTEVKPK